MSTVASIAVSWEQIHVAFAAKGQKHMKSLAKPAGVEAIKKLETTIGFALPDDFKVSLAIHDGQKSGAEVGEFPGIYCDDECGSFYLMTSKSILRDWKMLRSLKMSGDFDNQIAKPDSGVIAEWWHQAWIPFAANGGGDYLCLDLAPGTSGLTGQVIRMIHDNAGRKLIGKSFAKWLQLQAEFISDGVLPE